MWTANSRARLACRSSTSLSRAVTASVARPGSGGVRPRPRGSRARAQPRRETPAAPPPARPRSGPRPRSLPTYSVPSVVPVDRIGGGGDLHGVLPAARIPPAPPSATQPESQSASSRPRPTGEHRRPEDHHRQPHQMGGSPRTPRRRPRRWRGPPSRPGPPGAKARNASTGSARAKLHHHLGEGRGKRPFRITQNPSAASTTVRSSRQVTPR